MPSHSLARHPLAGLALAATVFVVARWSRPSAQEPKAEARKPWTTSKVTGSPDPPPPR